MVMAREEFRGRGAAGDGWDGGHDRVGPRSCQSPHGTRVWPRALRRGLPTALGLLLGLIGGFGPVGPARAQFNGDFTVERHRLDDENFLDWKAYQFSPLWRYEAFTAPNRFQGSAGSISQERFYLYQDLRLEADLAPYLTFLYMQEADAFYRSEPLYQELELRAGRRFYASAVGWVDADKRQNHAGYALAYGERTDWNFLRYTQLHQYLLFNEKNDQGAQEPLEYEQTPVMHRVEFRHFWGRRLLLDLTWITESEAELRNEDTAVTRRYEGSELDLTLDWWLSPSSLIGLHYFRDREERTQEPDAASAALPDLDQRLLLEWLDVYGSSAVAGRHQLTVGVLEGFFENRVRSGVADGRFRSRLTTTLAYATWEHAATSWMHGLFGLYSGEADERLRVGDDPAKSGNEDSLQVKAAAGLVLTEPGRYRVLFNSTWDLDILEQRAWDGGNVQVQIFF